MVRYWQWINQNENPIKFLTSSLESSLCDYSDASVLVTGNIAVVGAHNNTKVAFKNCAPFRKCRTEINETFINEAEHINIAMPMYNLIEYSDNYPYTSGSLWQFKRDEKEVNVDSNCYFINRRQCEIIKSEGFKRSVYWNNYKVIPNKTYNKNDYIRELLDVSCQGVKRLFVLTYRDPGCTNRVTADSHWRYFVPRIKIENYIIEMDGKKF